MIMMYVKSILRKKLKGLPQVTKYSKETSIFIRRFILYSIFR